MHFAEPGKHPHKHQKQNDNFGNHTLEAKPRKRGALFDAVDGLVNHLAADT